MAVAELTPDGTAIAVETTYTERSLMNLMPGARYHNGWTTRLSWPACLQLRGLFGAQLQVGPRLREWAADLRRERIDPVMGIRTALNLEGFDAKGDAYNYLACLEAIEAWDNPNERRLYHYQATDVLFLCLNGHAILGNEPGLGKTGALIRTLQVLNDAGQRPFPALVVCPNSLKNTVWANEIALWAPGLKVQVVHGGAATRRKQLDAEADVYVINWDMARLHSRLAPYGQIALADAEKTRKELNDKEFRTVILDEAHRLKDPHTKQTRAVWALGDEAEFRFALTGTPVADHLGDLWSLLRFVEPDWFPTKTKWMDRYAETAPNFYGGADVIGIKASTRAELFATIDPLIRRVPKRLALPQLPEKLPTQYRETPMTPKQEKAYRQMEKHLAALLDGQLLTAQNALSQIVRLTQFAAASAELSEPYEVNRRVRWFGSPHQKNNGKYVLNEDGTIMVTKDMVQDVLLSNPSSKVDDLIDLLEEMGDEPLVVAAMSRQLIELAAARLTDLKIPHGLVTGAQTPDERALNVARFQGGKTRVILLTLGAGAEGLTLTRASTMLFMQRSWSTIQNSQAEDRIHRIGSERHRAIRIVEQLTPGTIEERRLEVLKGKEDRIQEIIRDEAVLRQLLTGGKK